MRDYQIEVIREGRWWMVYVPEIDGLTQARRISEIEDMARSLIAVSTDTPVTETSVHVVSITVPGIGDIAAEARKIAEARRHAIAATEQAQEAATVYARHLAEAVPVRDVAELLHVSPQRVSQLTHA